MVGGCLLSLLRPEVLWVPSGQNVNGVNDRHAVMHRDHAPTYFGRWQFLLSDQLLRRIDAEAKDIPAAPLQRLNHECRAELGLAHTHELDL